ncbi:MAG TPA: hypothetical protein VF169_24075 [Albitalea sp.]|uniref:hypothetical protein n=1 Tax=Piscinibacter sp. TaxID=1903157 RepID=UPI002ED1DC89
MEGLWIRPTGNGAGIAFVSAAGKFLAFASSSLLFDGSLTPSAGNQWSFDAGSVAANASFAAEVTGSGSVAPNSQFGGSYTSLASGADTLSYDYSSGNALAASQSDVTATWSATGASFTVASDGTFNGGFIGGTFGACTLHGSVLHAQPATLKNLFAVSFSALDGTSGPCHLDTTQVYDGYAAISFVNVGSAGTPLYVRSLTVLVRTTNHSWVAAQLVKE